MRKTFLFLLFWILAQLAVAQNTARENTDMPIKTNQLIKSSLNWPNLDKFYPASYPFVLRIDSPISLLKPKFLWEEKQAVYPVISSHMSIFNSSERLVYPHFGGFFQIKSGLDYEPVEDMNFIIGGTLVRLDIPEPFSTQIKYGIYSSMNLSFI